MTIGLVALLATAGAAAAGEPMVLTDAQLDRVAAGDFLIITLEDVPVSSVSFYQERHANEAYIQTARERPSISLSLPARFNREMQVVMGDGSVSLSRDRGGITIEIIHPASPPVNGGR
jgi:antitoxin (DNA-binding transcriptional repressor) of toxin-antitoxin stability system